MMERDSGQRVAEARSIVTICSGLYLWMGMTAFPPSGFSLFPPGTKLPGHVNYKQLAKQN
jgi:hypothetical protein